MAILSVFLAILDHSVLVRTAIKAHLFKPSLGEVVFEVVQSAFGARHEFDQAPRDAGPLERRPYGRRLPFSQPRLEQRREELQGDPFLDEMLLKDGA